MRRNLPVKTRKNIGLLGIPCLMLFLFSSWPVLAQDEAGADSQAPAIESAPEPASDSPTNTPQSPTVEQPTSEQASEVTTDVPAQAPTLPADTVVDDLPDPALDITFSEVELDTPTTTDPSQATNPDNAELPTDQSTLDLESIDKIFTDPIPDGSLDIQTENTIPPLEGASESAPLEIDTTSADIVNLNAKEAPPVVDVLLTETQITDTLIQIAPTESPMDGEQTETLTVDAWTVSKDNSSELTRMIKNEASQEVKWFINGDTPLVADNTDNTAITADVGNIPISNINNLSLDLLNSHLDKLGLKTSVSLTNLKQSKSVFNNNKWYIDFAQSYRGIPVHDSNVSLVISDAGKLLAIHSSLKKIPDIDTTQAIPTDQVWAKLYQIPDFVSKNPDLISMETVIFPAVNAQKKTPLDFYKFPMAYKVKVKTATPQSTWTIIMDANSGEILLTYNELFFQDEPQDVPAVAENTVIQVVGSIFNVAVGALETVDFPYLKILYQNTDYFADHLGKVTLPPVNLVNGQDLQLIMDSPHFQVIDDDYQAANPPQTQKWDITGTTDNVIRLDLGIEISQPARTAYYLIETVNQYFRGEMSFDGPKLTVLVNSKDIDDVLAGCASYYSPAQHTLKLGRGEGCGSPNHAFSRDIVFHEYVHYLISNIHPIPNIDNSQSAAMSEGLADYYAASLNDDAVFGEKFLTKPRDLENNLTLNDWQNKTHEDSQIFSGSLWDLRKEIGKGIADKLIYDALYAGRRSFENFMYQLIIEDDDDDNLANGTPHLKKILYAFEQHGIGPGVTGFTIIPSLNPEDIPPELDPLFVTENPTITMSINNDTINFGSLSNTAITSPTVTTITVDTNAAEGFEGHIKSTGDGVNPGLYNAAGSSLIPAAISSAIANVGSPGYGIYAENPSAGIAISDAFNNDANNDAAVTANYQKIFSMTTTPAAPETVDLRYKAVVDAITPPGNYTDIIDVIVFGLF
jgi:hypothetical protein